MPFCFLLVVALCRHAPCSDPPLPLPSPGFGITISPWSYVLTELQPPPPVPNRLAVKSYRRLLAEDLKPSLTTLNNLMTVYSRWGKSGSARKVFDAIPKHVDAVRVGLV